MSNALTVTAPEGLPFINTSREFDAPVEAVFAAHTQADLFRRWIGAGFPDVDLPVFDCTSGGSYRFVHKSEQGEYGFHGCYHLVRENERIIWTFEFEGAPDIVSVETLDFVDLGGGRTRCDVHSVYPALEARDAMIQSGMQQGMEAGYAVLDALLAGVSA
jgi:uncharacterized protein YndB with AHSA1/START domain